MPNKQGQNTNRYVSTEPSLRHPEHNRTVPLCFGNVGRIHTHWDPDGTLKFSPQDNTTMIIEATKGRYGNNYLVNRNSEIYSATAKNTNKAPKSVKLFKLR